MLPVGSGTPWSGVCPGGPSGLNSNGVQCLTCSVSNPGVLPVFPRLSRYSVDSSSVAGLRLMSPPWVPSARKYSNISR